MSMPESSVPVDQATTAALAALAIGDTEILGEATDLREHLRAETSLDAKTFSLVKIGALVALDAGASPQEILSVLTAVAPQTGMPRVVAAAPEIMLALGLELPAEA